MRMKIIWVARCLTQRCTWYVDDEDRQQVRNAACAHERATGHLTDMHDRYELPPKKCLPLDITRHEPSGKAMGAEKAADGCDDEAVKREDTKRNLKHAKQQRRGAVW